jgi:uncharacterized Fe-S cluster-containing radical SAM superfamily enzyme
MTLPGEEILDPSLPKILIGISPANVLRILKTLEIGVTAGVSGLIDPESLRNHEEKDARTFQSEQLRLT